MMSWLITIRLIAGLTGTADAALPATVEEDEALVLPSAATANSQLQIYGFADTSYYRMGVGDRNILNAMWGNNGSFGVGNLNLYFDKHLGDEWRSLTEIRFSYLPQGTPQLGSGGVMSYAGTSAQDYTNLGFSENWGGIMIERAYIEYAPRNWLTLRAGQFLSPYGIWVMDHGSPTLITPYHPFVISAQLIPQKQAGLMATGNFLMGNVPLHYYLTLSNGRGPMGLFHDLDRNKAIGGRLEANMGTTVRLQTGVSAYRGEYTDEVFQMGLDASGQPTSTPTIRQQYHELALAADMRVEWSGLTIQAEIIYNQTAYTAKGRPPVSMTGWGFSIPGSNLISSAGHLASDRQGTGGYGLLAYRLPWFNIMPFYMAEWMWQNTGAAPEFHYVILQSVGVNVRVRPDVVVKAQYMHCRFTMRPSDVHVDMNNDDFVAQIAWAF